MKTTSVNPQISFAFGYFFTRNLPENQGLPTRNLPDESETFPSLRPLGRATAAGGWADRVGRAVTFGPAPHLIGRLAVPLVLALIAVGAAIAPVRAQSYEDIPPHLEERAQHLYGALMCPQCAGQTLDQSHAPIAETMRQVIRDQLIDGASDDAIVDLLVGAYGESILASPPARGFSLTVWVVPPIAILLGAAAVALAVRSLRRPQAAAPGGASPAGPQVAGAPELEQYLDVVDRELANETLGRDGNKNG